MSFAENALAHVPAPVRSLLLKHRELLKFAVVGGFTFVITVAVNYGLRLTVLGDKPVTALIIAVIVATIVSYVLNREWSFNTRGGRERAHEAALFFLISGIGTLLNAAPEWISHYWLDLQVPNVSRFTAEVADFASGMIIGTLVAMLFRWWAFRKWVFPTEAARPGRVRRLRAVRDDDQDEQVA